jgi:hypothetical protein
LAAFSVASAIFMAGVTVNRQTDTFNTMIGMLLIAYIVFTATALMLASTPGSIVQKDHEEAVERMQRFSIAISLLGNGIGVGIAWLTLRPLLVAIELDELARLFAWVLLVTTAAACARWSMILHHLLDVRRAAAAAVPGLGFFGACFYYLVLADALPMAWPGGDAPLVLSVVLFGIALLSFASQSILITASGRASFERLLERYGHRLALAYYAAASGALFLLWFAVSFP